MTCTVVSGEGSESYSSFGGLFAALLTAFDNSSKGVSAHIASRLFSVIECWLRVRALSFHVVCRRRAPLYTRLESRG